MTKYYYLKGVIYGLFRMSVNVYDMPKKQEHRRAFLSGYFYQK